MDRRISKTIKSVKKAFSNLISEKAYKDITVQDIIDEADIGRATFYSHYKNKEEVVNALVNDIFEHILSHNLDIEHHHDFSQKHNFSHRIEHMLYHFEEDKDMLIGLLNSEGGEIFLSALKKHLADAFKTNISLSKFDKIPENIVFNHAVTSLMQLILFWLKEDNCCIKPEDVADYYFLLNKDLFTE